MGVFCVTQNALGNGAWSLTIVISHPGSSCWGDTLPETNGFSPWKWMGWMGRTLVSFWGPAYFQGQTVSFRECTSLTRPIHTVHFSGNLPIIIATIIFRDKFQVELPSAAVKTYQKKWYQKYQNATRWKSFETQLRIVILHINVMICSGLLAVPAGSLGEAEVGSHLQLTWSVAAQWRVKHVEHWSNEKNPGCLGGFSEVTTQLYGENIS